MQKTNKSHVRLSADNNFFKFPFPVRDELLKSKLSGAEWAVMFFIICQTYGWGKQTDIITIKQFETNTTLCERTIIRALNRFKKLEWISIEKQSFKDGGHKANKITILLGVDAVNQNNNKKAEKKLNSLTETPDNSVTHNTEDEITPDKNVSNNSITPDKNVSNNSITPDKNVSNNTCQDCQATIDIKKPYIKKSTDKRTSIDTNSPPVVSKTQPSGDSCSYIDSSSVKTPPVKQLTTEEQLQQKELINKFKDVIDNNASLQHQIIKGNILTIKDIELAVKFGRKVLYKEEIKRALQNL